MSQSGAIDKPPQTGLVDMGDISFYNDPSNPIPTFTISDLANYAGSFSEIVLNVTWAELQPTENGPLTTTSITDAIDAVKTYNASNGTNLGIKLRVWGGYTAPDWAKDIDGPAISVTGAGTVNPNEDNPETIGRFWTSDYINAWTGFQQALAAEYDGNPLIRGISNTAGAAATDEPFVPLHPSQVAELEAGGYTDAAEELTLRAGIADYAAWSTTPLDYTTNLFHLENGGTVVADPDVTLAVLQEAENSSRIVQAGNHALNNPLPSADAFVYAQMAADAALDPALAPGSYQTASPVVLASSSSSNLGTTVANPYANWPAAIQQGVSSDAGDIELWDGPGTTGFTGEPTSAIAALAGLVANGVAPDVGQPDDGNTLQFFAPASVTGNPGAIAFSETDAVLLASAATADSYTITVTSADGNMLTVADAMIVASSSFDTILGADGQTLSPTANGDFVSDTSLSFSGSLGLVNTILASLTDNLASGTDTLAFTASDSNGDMATRTVGVTAVANVSSATTLASGTTPPTTLVAAGIFTWATSATSPQFSDAANWSPIGGPPGLANTAVFTGAQTPTDVAGPGNSGTLIVDDVVVLGGGSTLAVGSAGSGNLEIAAPLGTASASGMLVLAGVNSEITIAGNLDVGSTGVLLAGLAPNNYSTAELTIGGTLQIGGGGVARFSGALNAGTIEIAASGLLSGDGTLTETGSHPIVNAGTIEVVADQILGQQLLTVASPIAGAGTIIVDPAAALILDAALGPQQTLDFAPPSIQQLADTPYSPSTLVLEVPYGFSGDITGFSFADSLVLDGVQGIGIDYVSNLLTIDVSNGSTLTFNLTGELTNLTPTMVVTGTGTLATTTVTFVAKGLGQRPSVVAPGTLQAAAGVAVQVPGIVLDTPLPATPIDNTTIVVTVTAGTGSLSANADAGNTTISQPNPQTLILAGSLGAVETSLESLTYTGSSAGTDTISVFVSDYDGMAPKPATIAVTNGGTVSYDWIGSRNGSFASANDWRVANAPAPSAPGGADLATFGPGTEIVDGDGAVGLMAVTGTVTLTGAVSIQGLAGEGVAATVDQGGELALVGGGVLTVGDTMVVGFSQDGLLTVMGGALALSGTTTANALVLGQNSNGIGTILDLEQIEAAGTIVVGADGSGTLRLLGNAATVSDGGSDIGQGKSAIGAVVVDGGEWATNGLLSVGDAGHGSLLIGGSANGITGQTTAYNATIGAQQGGVGTLTVTGGDLLVANGLAASSTLTVGDAGTGVLALSNGGNVTVGVAEASIPIKADGTVTTTLAYNTGTLVVGAAGGQGVVTIAGDSALLIDGSTTIGATGSVTVGQGSDSGDLLAMLGTLTIGASGQVSLNEPGATIRADAVTIAAGGTLSGAGTLSGDGGGNYTSMLTTISDDGVIAATGGNLLVYGGVSGVGTLEVLAGATLTLQASVGSGQVLSFSEDAHATLDDVLAFNGTITGFAAGNVLDLASTDATGSTWNDGTLTLTGNTGEISLQVAGNYHTDSFATYSDKLGGTLVELAPSENPPCFVAGTRIQTQTGLVPVEKLVIGDMVMTVTDTCKPIEWIGQRLINCQRHPTPRAVWPIRISANAFGRGLPARALHLSPDHAIYAEGVLIPVKHLLNDRSVRQMQPPSVAYYHLELLEHDVVLAEGLPTETFLDTGNRSAFSNATGPVTLHPDFRQEQCALQWEAFGYAPLRVTGPEVERVRAQLAAGSQPRETGSRRLRSRRRSRSQRRARA